MAAEGHDLELRLGLLSARIAFDLDLNVDLLLFASPILVENLALVVYESLVAVAGNDVPAPVPSAVTESPAVKDVEMRALVGDDVPVPPKVTESAVVPDVKMGALVVYEGPAAGDGAATEVGVLATLDDEPQGEARQIVLAGSADPTGDGAVPPLPEAAAARRRDPVTQSRRRADMHRLPRDLPQSYIGEKVVSKSDMNPRHARFFLPARARARLRAFLYPAEITACNFNTTDPKPIRIPGVRARPTTYPGVSLSVYVSSGWGRGQCKSDRQKLNKFHRNDATAINGNEYRRFMVDCSLEAGDGVEVWAFRWPLRIGMCLLVAKNDGVRPARNT
ncbi:hypothetical protein VPH35_100352 [Triticum aestivum]